MGPSIEPRAARRDLQTFFQRGHVTANRHHGGMTGQPIRLVGHVEGKGGTYGTMGGMEKTTVYLPNDLKQALRRESKATGRSEAELIREGIGLVTGSYRVAEPTLPLFESGIPDLAERVDELLEGYGER